MTSPFFKALFKKNYALNTNIIVLDFFKGWLSKHDKVLLIFFNNALKANKTFIDKTLAKQSIKDQYDFLNSEILDLEFFFKKNPVQSKILFKKIGEVDELYKANEILDLVSLIHYSFLEAYFSLLDFHRNNLKEEHFQDEETALDIFNSTRNILNEFKTSDKVVHLDFYYQDSKILTGLASYLVFVGYSLQIYYRLRPIKEQLVAQYPDLVFVQKQKKETKKKPDLQKNLIDKLPSDWKDKPLSEYFSFLFYQDFPNECKRIELDLTIEKRKTQQKIRSLNHTESVAYLESKIKLISDDLDSPEVQQYVSLFTTSMEEYFTDLNLGLDVAFLIKESDDYFYSEDEISRSEDLINNIDLLEDLPLFDSNRKLNSDISVKEDLNYLDKWIINPRVSGFLEIKCLIEKKEFFVGVLNDLKVEENNAKCIKKQANNSLKDNNIIDLDMNLNNNTESQYSPRELTLIIHYFLKYYDLDISAKGEKTRFIKFLHLLSGKEYKSIQNSNFNELVTKAPSFGTRENTIQHLKKVKEHFEKFKLTNIILQIENDIEGEEKLITEERINV